MTAKELNEVGRRYLFLMTELEECPELRNDQDFMRRYKDLHSAYVHFYKKSRKWQGFINDIRRYNDEGVI